MKGDECAAANRNRRGGTRHHIVVSTAVIRVLVTDGPNNRVLIKALRHLRHAFREMHPWHACRDGLELPANLRRGLRLGIEGLVVRRPAIQPDHDAIHVLARAKIPRRTRLTLEAKKIAKTKAQRPVEAEFEKVAPGYSGTVTVERHGSEVSD